MLKYAISGVAAPIIFLFTYAVMASFRDDYTMFTKAVSELGSLDAPNKWWWNVLGYIIPGILIMFFSKGLFVQIDPKNENRMSYLGLLGSGLGMTIAGIFPGDFDNRQSITMLLHTVGSFGSYISFLFAAFGITRSLRKAGDPWPASVNLPMIFALATILFGAWPFIFPSTPGIGQRLVFLFYFLWIGYLAMRLFTSVKSPRSQ